MNSIASSDDIWSAFCRHVGLDSFKTEIVKREYGQIELCLYRSFPAADLHASNAPESFHSKFLKPMFDRIKTSSLVQDELKELKTQNSLLRKELDELKSFKIYMDHFRMSFIAQHGKEPKGLRLPGVD